ncbi:MAG: amino acid permease [Thermoanaerobaculaceae bacterium]|jgi:APA family basic amino acid/polyamine antiporter|nr:amino acid permease [Thermoanaerobaculaceae bacterium]
MSSSLLRTKPLTLVLKETEDEKHGLRRVLKVWDLIAIGIGCIIGVGIFVLPGVEAANHAGPGIILSFVIAAAACGCAALCYAELAAMIPVAGSAYTYGYATLGEIVAWIIGWDLILEYMVGASLVAIGWSAYLVNLVNHLLQPMGVSLPHAWCAPPWAPQGQQPGILNLPAVLIIAVLTWLLVRGIKESARVNLIMVIIKVVVILIFIGLTAWYVNPTNWNPFMPFGFKGVVTAAAIVFLAYVGFDAVSTTAEEAVNPQRDMPIGIMGSLAVATVLYVVVAAIMTGVVPYKQLNVADPVALVLNVLNMPWASVVVSVGALAGITSVLLVLLLGQPRILFAMSRDGLLPPLMSKVHERFRTPYLTTIITGIVVAVSSALTPINVVAELCSIGTLFAFMIVSAGVLVLRRTRSEVHRPFKAPLYPAIPILGIVLCGYLMLSLPFVTWLRFLVWLLIGLTIYAGYSFRHSRLAPKQA